ncbi:21 kDa protein-like [Punica granatum]|uniref:Pectinesterase inhibitor domain-containing protein n=2 Tax=Punica granatum TaxID=22663 RepID=A0A218WTI3_PUNGR|nr:21 kDa protein-like [Punica granatum]OWM75680.1 hypothetical protein CDL15_Pgr021845 [Punica granatum]PKI54497.1 hypothetical protein CRG98_025011 [Punica granatum]
MAITSRPTFLLLLLLLGLPSLLVISSATAATTSTSASASGSAATSFIKSSCTATRFPALCVQSLSSYASSIQQNPRQLAQAALSVSLVRAQAAKDFVAKSTKFRGLKAREFAAIKDCLDEMDDTVDRLSKSMAEMKGMGKSNGQEFLWHVSNVQTWVSAALTDENTCFDGYSSKTLDGRLKASIRVRVLNVAQVTSNALALVNRFASN